MSKQNTVNTDFNTKSETFEIPKRLRKPHNPLVKEMFDGTFEAKVEVVKTDYKRKGKYKDDYESILDVDRGISSLELKHISDKDNFDVDNEIDDETLAFYLNKK